MNDFLKFMKKEITEKDVIETYKNLKKKIDEYGFTVSGTVDGEGALERPFAQLTTLLTSSKDDIIPAP